MTPIVRSERLKRPKTDFATPRMQPPQRRLDR